MTDLVSRDINWARKITERLRLQATNYQEAREKVLATLVEARARITEADIPSP